MCMATPILICDDSSFARKQIARTLPGSLSESVSFATNGEEALKIIRSGKADLMFLDLNMPILDGYEVLQQIRKGDLQTMVIVVSGDIQPEAYKRVMSLGALEFIKKPVSKEQVAEVLSRFGIEVDSSSVQKKIEVSTDSWDCYRELANVAMGQAADLLARLLGVFIKMPVPKVKLIRSEDLKSTFELIDKQDKMSAVCQGFIGSGIAGEAILIFNQSSFTDIADLMSYEGKLNEVVELELLMDIGSVMIGAFLKGIANQLEVNFSQGSPVVVSKHCKMSNTLAQEKPNWKQSLAIEMRCSIEKRNIKCNILLLFTEDSLKPLNNIMSILAE